MSHPVPTQDTNLAHDCDHSETEWIEVALRGVGGGKLDQPTEFREICQSCGADVTEFRDE